jgi:hypothetical protein
VKDIREPDGHFGAFANLGAAAGLGIAHLLEGGQQELEVVLHHLVAKCRIAARAQQIVLARQRPMPRMPHWAKPFVLALQVLGRTIAQPSFAVRYRDTAAA